MRKLNRIPAFRLLSTLIYFLWSGCTPDQVYHAAQINAGFRLQSQRALAGKITIDQAYLKLREIQVTGNGERDNTNITVGIDPEEPPYQLSHFDSSQISFNLPSRQYNQLDFHLYLLQDTYQPIIHEQEIDNGPPNGAGDGIEQPDTDEDDQVEDPGDGDDTQGEGDDSDDGEDGGGQGDDDGNDEDDGDDEDDNDDDADDEHDDKGKNKNDKDGKDKDKNKDKDNDDDDEDEDDRDNDGGRVLKSMRQTVDIDDFFQNAKPGLVIAGTYQNNGKTLKLIFVADNILKLSVTGQRNDSQNIILNERNTADIVFNPEKWFETISTSTVESANIQVYQGQQVIFIHSKFNTPLHEALTAKLEASATLNIAAIPPANL